jgi:hypothetical protein
MRREICFEWPRNFQCEVCEVCCTQSNSLDRVSRLETALVHLTSWFYHNGLALNPEKSEAILLGTSGVTRVGVTRGGKLMVSPPS